MPRKPNDRFGAGVPEAPRFTNGMVVEITGGGEFLFGIITRINVDKGEAHLLIPTDSKYPTSTVENLFNLRPVLYTDRNRIPWSAGSYADCYVVHNSANFGMIQHNRKGRYYWNHISTRGGVQDVTDDLGKFFLMSDITIGV